MIRRAGSLLVALLALPLTLPAQTWVVIPPATPLASLPPLRLARGMAGLVGEVRSACEPEGIVEASIFLARDSVPVASSPAQRVTGPRGLFARDSLLPGRYRVRVAAIGYAPVTRIMELAAGRVDTVRATMEPATQVTFQADCLVRLSDGTIGLAGCPQVVRPPCR